MRIAALPQQAVRKRSTAPTLILTAPAVWFIGAVWGAVAVYLGASGVFESSPEKPPIAVLIAALAPGLVFLTAFGLYKPVRLWVRELDIAEVIAIQSWRVVGFAFLAVWALGDLPAVFALPAGLGDIAVGVAAPAAALAIAENRKNWRRAAYGVTFAGLADFIVAFATGIFSREGGLLHFEGAPASSLLGTLPLSLFPTFIVPAFMIFHIIALLKLSQR